MIPGYYIMTTSLLLYADPKRIFRIKKKKKKRTKYCSTYILFNLVNIFNLKGRVHGSVHGHESKYFLAFARYDPILFNLIRCLWTIRKGIE